jgi:hypothetical protein
MTSQRMTDPRCVYVAAASGDYRRAREAMIKLDARGLRVAYDWTHDVERAREQRRDEASMTIAERVQIYHRDLTALDSASFVWLLVPSIGMGGAGCWCEFQAAVERRKHTIASGPYARRSAFVEQADQIIGNDSDVLEYLESMATMLERATSAGARR